MAMLKKITDIWCLSNLVVALMWPLKLDDTLSYEDDICFLFQIINIVSDTTVALEKKTFSKYLVVWIKGIQKNIKAKLYKYKTGVLPVISRFIAGCGNYYKSKSSWSKLTKNILY